MKLQKGIVYATRIFSVGDGETNQTRDKNRFIGHAVQYGMRVSVFNNDFLHFTNSLYKDSMIAIIKIYPKQNIKI